MKIEANKILTGTDKTIEFYNSTIIVKDGPNMTGNMKLCDIRIPYDSFTASKMSLPSGGREFPVMYGFLGTNITLLIIKATYGGDSANLQKCSFDDKYIEYYFENDPLNVRYMTDIMILSGDSNHRLPQVYLYNPTSYAVSVEILMANINPNEISSALVETYEAFTGLVFNDIVTDQVYGINCTGSTQYEILDIDGNVQAVVPYNKLDIISIDSNTIIITTKSDNPVKLVFVSESQAKQALSRINYVREGSISKFLTKTNTGWDSTSPVMVLKTSGSTITMSGYTTITKQDIIYRFVDSITDYDDNGRLRDGVINVNNTKVMIMNEFTGQILDSITTDGYYMITLSVSDLAGNNTSINRRVLKDGTAPTVNYKTYGDMSLENYPSSAITMTHIKNFIVSDVWDAIDGVVPLSSVQVTVNGTQNDITVIGTYVAVVTVSDTAGNTTINNKTVNVIN